MWVYEKKLEFPVKIKKKNPALAKFIIAQYGGPESQINFQIVLKNLEFTPFLRDCENCKK